MADYDEEQDERVTKIARQQPDVALKLAKDLVTRFPKVDRSWASLSYVYTVKKEHSEALTAMLSALHIDPDKPANLFDVSRIYIKLNFYREAVENLSRCIKISDEIGNSYYSEACYFYRAFCYCRLGDFYGAKGDLGQVADEGTFWVGRALTKADLEKACRRKRLD